LIKKIVGVQGFKGSEVQGYIERLQKMYLRKILNSIKKLDNIRLEGYIFPFYSIWIERFSFG
jgi:NurA-like 5'-3' nuclease